MLTTKASKTNRHRPLSGRTVLITRSKEGNRVEKLKLEVFGARVVELPALKIMPPRSWKRVDEALLKIDEFDWIILTSSNGVKWLFRRLRQLNHFKDMDNVLSHVKFACVGPATSEALRKEGLNASFVPRKFKTSDLGIELSRKIELRTRKILLARSEIANKEISNILRHAGACITDIAVYRTVLRTRARKSSILNGVTDVTLTSPSTVDGLTRAVSPGDLRSKSILVHCIGPVTAARATSEGLRVDTIAKVHTVDGLIENLISCVTSDLAGRQTR